MLDIIFETRNKEYGAYFLRRNYPIFMRNALAIGVGLIVLVFLLPGILATVNSLVQKPKVDVIAELGPPPDIENTPPPPPPPPVETPPPPTRPTVRFVPPLVQEDKKVVEEKEMIDLDKPIEVEIAKKTVEGDPNANTITPNEAPEDLDETEVVKEAAPEEPLTFVEAMPQFPAKRPAQVPRREHQVPAPSPADRASRAVFLSFVVEKSGQITDMKVVKDISGGCGRKRCASSRRCPRGNPATRTATPCGFSEPACAVQAGVSAAC